MSFRFIRRAWRACGIAAVLTVLTPAAAAPLTLEEAVRIAEQQNPALQNTRAALHAAEGQISESRALLWSNPELSLERSRVRVPNSPTPGDRYDEWRAGIAQPFEIGGQQGRRREAAEAEIAAINAAIGEARAALRADVEQRFVQVLALQTRAGLEKQTVALIEQAASAVEKRREAGESSRLEANLALVEAERARNQLVQAEEQLAQARSELATLLQLPPGELPEAAGDLRRDGSYTLDDLLGASSRRRQLEALNRREQAARSRLELERASRYPDVTVGLFTGREGPSDLRGNVTGMTLSVPLPLFRRNEAAIGRATTDLTQVQIERRAAERDAGAGVRAQWLRVTQLEARARRLREAVLRTLEENQRLSQMALREGEIGISELLLVNRQLAETRREQLEAETELRQARIALERAAGWPPIDSKETK